MRKTERRVPNAEHREHEQSTPPSRTPRALALAPTKSSAWPLNHCCPTLARVRNKLVEEPGAVTKRCVSGPLLLFLLLILLVVVILRKQDGDMRLAEQLE
eukprot:2881883-Prymnesium_polylepis.1